ncbi:hypothetical protein [Falsiroseomonas sp. E2-1-a4]|uniref:hypothetical protein n=1 Tax=Falsiroseomonas sp. E2-1-a4 TaxID=3239299 RepID=UPI003F313324
MKRTYWLLFRSWTLFRLPVLLNMDVARVNAGPGRIALSVLVAALVAEPSRRAAPLRTLMLAWLWHGIAGGNHHGRSGACNPPPDPLRAGIEHQEAAGIWPATPNITVEALDRLCAARLSVRRGEPA